MTRKTILIIMSIILLSETLYGQVKSKTDTTKIQVYGSVVDSAQVQIMNAEILLLMGKDSLKGNTNDQGQFSFQQAGSAKFVIKVQKTGYYPLEFKYSGDGKSPIIILPIITMKSKSILLNEVVVKGAPAITYKSDTVEYKAKDFKVRDFANVSEMLKKMPGMEVSGDGTLTHIGQNIVKARLNGKDFAGGDVAQAINNLPADIVDKIQIVDDYDDEGGRTGLKTGDPKRVINITTLANRSQGSLLKLNAGAGNNNRYDAGLNAERINANEEIGILDDVNNTQNGIASNVSSNNGGSPASSGKTGNGSGSGGTITTEGTSFYYRDQWSKQVQFNSGYSFTDKTTNAVNNSTIQQIGSLGTTGIINNSISNNNSKKHNLNIELDYYISQNDFLKIASSVSISQTDVAITANQIYSGLSNQIQNNNSNAFTKSPVINGVLFYQHKSTTSIRNFSAQLDLTGSDNTIRNDNYKHIRYYDEDLQNIIKDSLQNYLLNKGNYSRSYKAALSYIEPLGYLSQLEISAKVNYNKNHDIATLDSITATATPQRLDILTSAYRYTFANARFSMDYWTDRIKYNFSIGAALIPYTLNGAQLVGLTGNNKINGNYIIPVFRFQYIWSKTQKLTINYSGQVLAPSYDQLQPFTDKSDPQNIMVGNPELVPSFSHSVITQYNNYFVDSKWNISFLMLSSLYAHSITDNTKQIYQPSVNSYYNETYYLNMGNRYAVRTVYNVSKQTQDNKVILSLLGRVSFSKSPVMSNDIPSYNDSWHFSEKLSAKIDLNDHFEINPNVSYDTNSNLFGINKIQTNVKTTSFSLDGRIYLDPSLSFGYSTSKNFITGLSSDITKNPFVINSDVEKSFLKRHNLILSIQVFDLLHQNNYINQIITENSITDSRTNTLSRYVMLSLRLNLQRWNGVPTRNGVEMQRRGDGSFIY